MICNDPFPDSEEVKETVERQYCEADAPYQNRPSCDLPQDKDRLERLNIIGKWIDLEQDLKGCRDHVRSVGDRAGNQQNDNNIANHLLGVLEDEIGQGQAPDEPQCHHC